MNEETQVLLSNLNWAVMDGSECIAAFLLQCDALNLIKYLVWVYPDRLFELLPLGGLALDEFAEIQLAEIHKSQAPPSF